MKKKQEEHQSKMGLNLAGKRKSRGGALMEGSRCSRVNGRGWRCCQQTLVGYSLCEHHLGKGRLRSMNSVRSRSSPATVVEKEDNKKPSPSPSPRPPLTLTSKKRTKLGVVKARSISSLLGQPDGVMAVAPPPPLPPTPPDDNIDGKKL
ncbi:growth-regulating factor 9-like [Cucurbita pepo subsp. pepo]|nr:growth-regulating factor 9-like [Cucurbita pepo subsp. pepo]